MRDQIRDRRGVERVNVVRFGDSYDHRSVWAALDVKWLRVNFADDRAIKVQVAHQVGGGRRREGRIDVNAIARRIVVLLRDVDLRIGRQSGSAANSNEKRKFHSSEIDDPRPLLQSAPTVCQGFTAAQWSRKSNGLSFSLGSVASATARLHCVLRKCRGLLLTRFNLFPSPRNA